MLQVTTQPLEDCEVMMNVEVDEQQTDKLLKAAARRIASQVRLPGFRPGKAPYGVIVQRFGEEVIREEALEDLTKSVFEQALEQADVEPYAPAALEEISWDPLVMKVRVPVAPVIELGDYRSMRIDFEPVEVSQDELNEALETLQDEYAIWNPVERPARLGDQVVMAVRQQAGDETLAENESVEYELVEVDAQAAGPDLTTPLIGLSAGEEKEFTVTYPENVDDPRYAGQEVSVWVEVQGVKEKKVYPLDDDFAQTVGDFDTLEGLKEKLTEDIRRRKQREVDNKLGEEALQQLIENAEHIEWPKALEEDELDRALEEQDRRMKGRGLSLDTYLSMQKQTREDLREEFRPAVRERLQRSLVLSKLVKLEDLSIEGHELADQIDRMSIMAGNRGAELRQALSTPESMRHMANDLLASKATQRLTQIVKGEAEEQVKLETETEMEPRAEEETDIEEEKTDSEAAEDA